MNRLYNLTIIIVLFAPNQAQVRVETKEAINYAQTLQKHYYDKSHHPGYLRVGDSAYIRLYKGYFILAIKNTEKKLGQQYMGPFRIIRRIKRLIYEFKLFNYWKIYLVFTIIILKPGLVIKDDSYNRSRPDYLDSVFVDGDTEFLKSFKISKIIDKRVIYKGRIRKRIIEYLVR